MLFFVLCIAVQSSLLVNEVGMLSRRITSTVIERCRDILANASRADSRDSNVDVPLALRSELEQLHSKMTSMLRQAEKLEDAHEKALVLEREELQDIPRWAF